MEMENNEENNNNTTINENVNSNSLVIHNNPLVSPLKEISISIQLHLSKSKISFPDILFISIRF